MVLAKVGCAVKCTYLDICDNKVFANSAATNICSPTRSQLRIQKMFDRDSNTQEGARHCRKPLGRSVEQSFNKLAYKSCQNICSCVGLTKSRAFAYKSCQNSSSYVRMTKK